VFERGAVLGLRAPMRVTTILYPVLRTPTTIWTGRTLTQLRVMTAPTTIWTTPHLCWIALMRGQPSGTACTFTAGTADTEDQCATLTSIMVTFNQIHSQIYLIDGSEEDDTGFNPTDMTISANNLETPGTTPVAAAAGTHVQGSYQHQECSLRGMCDSSTGICKCFEGYTGDACEVQSSLAY